MNSPNSTQVSYRLGLISVQDPLHNRIQKSQHAGTYLCTYMYTHSSCDENETSPCLSMKFGYE